MSGGRTRDHAAIRFFCGRDRTELILFILLLSSLDLPPFHLAFVAVVRGERKSHDADNCNAEEDECEGGRERRLEGLNFLRTGAVNAAPTLRGPQIHLQKTAGIYSTLYRCRSKWYLHVGSLVRATKKKR